MATGSTSAKFTRQAQGRPQNKVWKHFLETFYVKTMLDNNNKKIDIKATLSVCLEPLERMAEVEDWGNDRIILVNYFVHTFYGLREAQKKEPAVGYVVEYKEWIYFNTGLLTGNMEPIYAAYQVNHGKGAKETDGKPQYFLDNNVSHFMRDVHTIPYCNPLPERCRYFADYTHLIMDGTKVPTVSWTHIIEENWDRICAVLYPLEDAHDERFKVQQQYDARTRLDGALQTALNRVRANYRTAVPHSFKGELQLLLPLCILEANKPDLVLTISRVDLKPPVPGKFTYTARTILTLDMAYQNARLVARPEKDWLLAPKTVTETDEAF